MQPFAITALTSTAGTFLVPILAGDTIVLGSNKLIPLNLLEDSAHILAPLSATTTNSLDIHEHVVQFCFTACLPKVSERYTTVALVL